MQAHPAAHTHPDKADLAAFAPHPGHAGPSPGRDCEGGQGADEQFLEQAQPVVQITAAPAQVDERIAHHLAGSVPGDVTAAIDPQHLRLRVEQVGRIAAPADGVHRGMFEQEQGLRGAACGNVCGQPFLPGQGQGVVDPAAVDHLHGRIQHRWARR